MSKDPASIVEYRAQRARIEAAGVKSKFDMATEQTWLVEVVFTDRDGVGDLMSLTSVREVDEFLGSWCPECWRIDRRRTRGGVCSACARA